MHQPRQPASQHLPPHPTRQKNTSRLTVVKLLPALQRKLPKPPPLGRPLRLVAAPAAAEAPLAPWPLVLAAPAPAEQHDLWLAALLGVNQAAERRRRAAAGMAARAAVADAHAEGGQGGVPPGEAAVGSQAGRAVGKGGGGQDLLVGPGWLVVKGGRLHVMSAGGEHFNAW